MKNIELIYNEDEDDYEWPDPEKPKRKPDFQKHNHGLYIEEGIIASNDLQTTEHLAFCPRTGYLMSMEDQGMWVILSDGFQEAYKKWAKKTAEKVLLGP